MSADTHIFEEANFIATSLAPPETKIVTHIKTEQQLTWELNGEAG